MIVYIVIACILILFITHRKIKILIGTPIIDRDIDILKEFIQHLKPYLNRYNFRYSCDSIFITRTSDKKVIDHITKLNHPKVILEQVEHYDITERHNFEHLARKRQYILDYASENNYDYVWFVDSDVMIKPNTLDLLLNAKVSCCYCPIKLHWSDEKLIGTLEHNLIDASTIESDDKYMFDIIGGFGCTLINKDAFDIPMKVSSEEVTLHDKKQIVTGEDIAFYIDCISNGKITACLLNHDIRT